jgi:hypothetical protein
MEGVIRFDVFCIFKMISSFHYLIIKHYQMKKTKVLSFLPLLALVLCLTSFGPMQSQSAKIPLNYAWYTPSGQFVAWSTLVNAEVVSGDDTNPVNGSLDLEGFTGGGAGLPPSGTLVYKLYSHP